MSGSNKPKDNKVIPDPIDDRKPEEDMNDGKKSNKKMKEM